MEPQPTALVTGAASGIGRATALLLVSRGWRVIGLDRRSADLGGVQMLTGDAGDEAAVRAAVIAAGGALDGLVCSAGIPPAGPWDDLSAFDEILRVNLRGPYLALRAALPALRATHGAAVLVGSIVGAAEGATRSPAYAAAKVGLEGLARSMALVAAPEVRVNVVGVGAVNTDFEPPALPPQARPDVPLGRMADPDEIAAVIAFLLSGEASYATGAVWRVDGGRTVLPGHEALRRGDTTPGS